MDRYQQHLHFCNIFNFKNANCRKKNLIQRRNFFSLSDEEFRQRNRALSPSEMVLLSLRFYATSSFLIVIGDYCGVSVATASRVVKKVSKAIAKLSTKFIAMSDTEEDMRNTVAHFYNIAKFPKVIGAIDCTHVKIQSLGGFDAEIWRCRKGYFSLNIQAICNSNLEVLDVVARWPGSAHDIYLFNNSRIKARFEYGEFGSYLLLADGGYGVKPYLMTPLGNPQTEGEKLYNESQIRTRNVIERCFGVLKRRFPVLSLGMRVALDTIMAILVSCCVLHNLCRLLKDDNDFDTYSISSDEEDITPDRVSRTRNNIIENYFSRL